MRGEQQPRSTYAQQSISHGLTSPRGLHRILATMAQMLRRWHTCPPTSVRLPQTTSSGILLSVALPRWSSQVACSGRVMRAQSMSSLIWRPERSGHDL